MLCSEIMKRDVECVTADDTLDVAASKMRDGNLGFLPVVNDQRKVIGTLTDRDLAIRAIAQRLPYDTPVGDVMTRELVACLASDDVRRAEERMARFQKSRIICLDDQGRLCGVISLSDIARHETDERAADTLRQVAEREAEPVH